MRLLDSRLPIVAAPMAGGPTTVALARAVAEAGGFPFLAAGYRTPEALALEIEQVRALGVPFGVNLFVPSRIRPDRTAFAGYAARLASEAEVYGLRLDPEPVTDDDHWADKLALLTEHPVPVVSTTFGLPGADEVAALRRAGSLVLATVTTPAEAVAAQGVRVDGLTVQAPGAGGHSATFDPTHPPGVLVDADVLVGRVREVTDLPIIAAGGVDGPGTVRRILDSGAEAVAVGTLFLRTDEAGTSAPHRAALTGPEFGETALTRVFTGRPARALRNGFVDRHDAHAPDAYPAVHHLTRALRQAAGRAGDTDRLHLWAGTGYRNAPAGPAGEVVRWLAKSC